MMNTKLSQNVNIYHPTEHVVISLTPRNLQDMPAAAPASHSKGRSYRRRTCLKTMIFHVQVNFTYHSVQHDFSLRSNNGFKFIYIYNFKQSFN